MVKYIISTGGGFVGEGNKIKYQGEYYVVLTDREKAKRYSSRARAENARKRLLSYANKEKSSRVVEVDE